MAAVATGAAEDVPAGAVFVACVAFVAFVAFVACVAFCANAAEGAPMLIARAKAKKTQHAAAVKRLLCDDGVGRNGESRGGRSGENIVVKSEKK
jgi:hypothetical protein